jgi:hypothetical protein
MGLGFSKWQKNWYFAAVSANVFWGEVFIMGICYLLNMNINLIFKTL